MSRFGSTTEGTLRTTRVCARTGGRCLGGVASRTMISGGGARPSAWSCAGRRRPFAGEALEPRWTGASTTFGGERFQRLTPGEVTRASSRRASWRLPLAWKRSQRPSTSTDSTGCRSSGTSVAPWERCRSPYEWAGSSWPSDPSVSSAIATARTCLCPSMAYSSKLAQTWSEASYFGVGRSRQSRAHLTTLTTMMSRSSASI